MVPLTDDCLGDDTVLSSLTLGGYDTSRFIPNDLSFGFAPDNERDIVVGVVGITTNTATQTNVDLLARDDFTMYIDSSVAELYLPIEVCEAFEKAFGLVYDNVTELYLVSDLLHEQLQAENANITFSLGQKFANTTVNITLPYAALDKEASPPYRGLENATNYFPIRRAQNDTQFVLGRTFLQEAYLIVDWERQNFSVSEVNWVLGGDPTIVSIISPDYMPQTQASKKPHSGLSTGAIIGIAIGGGFLFAMVVSGIAWMYWRRRQKRKLEKVKADYAAKAAAKPAPSDKSEETPTSPVQEEKGTNVFPKAELPADSARTPELGEHYKDGSLLGGPAEADSMEHPIFEMPGDMPVRQEAGGRQLSEKESMMVRERIINGVDPNGPPSISPLSTEPPRRFEPVSPSDVAIVGRRLPNVSPTTPRTPTPRDGSSLEASDTFFQRPPRSVRDGRSLEAEETLMSPISPLEPPSDTSRRRFSYES